MPAKWSSKFRLKNKKDSWVFVPTPESASAGDLIKQDIGNRWKAPSYYFHLQKGGHVAALSSHLSNLYYLHLDIQDFFGSISKNRVTRALRKIVGHETAREYAKTSTVYHPSSREKKTILPFGFIQSQLLASVCLRDSALGRFLDKISKSQDFVVSVYVDDIVVSSSDLSKLNECFCNIQHAASLSRFSFNNEKTEGPSTGIVAFNIKLENQLLSICRDKLFSFKERCKSAESLAERSGVIGYVRSVNTDQADEINNYLTSALEGVLSVQPAG